MPKTYNATATGIAARDAVTIIEPVDADPLAVAVPQGAWEKLADHAQFLQQKAANLGVAETFTQKQSLDGGADIRGSISLVSTTDQSIAKAGSGGLSLGTASGNNSNVDLVVGGSAVLSLGTSISVTGRNIVNVASPTTIETRPGPASRSALANTGLVRAALTSFALSNATRGTLPVAAQWAWLRWNGSTFCVLEWRLGIPASATSPDGLTWTSQSIGGSARGLAWNGSVFCTVSPDGTYAMLSPDGITWTPYSTMPVPGAYNSWADIAWNGSVFCAVASSVEPGYAGHTSTSADGITWTAPVAVGGASIAAKGSTFCIGSERGAFVYTSTNGQTWSSPALPQDPVPYYGVRVGSNGSMFLAAAHGTTLAATSTDGLTWTRCSMPFASYWSAIEGIGNLFCVGCNEGVLVGSAGAGWLLVPLPANAPCGALAYDGNAWCAVGGSSSVSSNVAMKSLELA